MAELHIRGFDPILPAGDAVAGVGNSTPCEAVSSQGFAPLVPDILELYCIYVRIRHPEVSTYPARMPPTGLIQKEFFYRRILYCSISTAEFCPWIYWDKGMKPPPNIRRRQQLYCMHFHQPPTLVVDGSAYSIVVAGVLCSVVVSSLYPSKSKDKILRSKSSSKEFCGRKTLFESTPLVASGQDKCLPPDGES